MRIITEIWVYRKKYGVSQQPHMHKVCRNYSFKLFSGEGLGFRAFRV